jgi:hypothetical protein
MKGRNISDEELADLNAIKVYIKLGYTEQQAIDTFAKVFLMENKEFRIGNKVYDEDNNIRTIVGIGENGIDLLCLGCNKSSFRQITKKVFPIPFTKEIILQLGLRKEKCKIANRYSFKNDTGEKFIVEFCDMLNEIHCIGIQYRDIKDDLYNFAWHIKYVHDFQNIVFVLTRKELEINLKTK